MRGVMVILLLSLISICGYTQENTSFLYSYYKSFVESNKGYLEGYVFLSNSIGRDETILRFIDQIPASRLPRTKNASPKILQILADSIYKGAQLNLQKISSEEFANLPPVINAGFTAEEFNAKLEMVRLDSLMAADEKNRSKYQKKRDSLNKSDLVISYDNKAQHSMKRLLTFLPPVIYGQKLVIACVTYHSLTDSHVLCEIYSMTKER